MKTKGRMMLLLMLVATLLLGYVVWHGFGADKRLSVYHIEQGLDLSGGVDILYEANKEDVTDAEMAAAISLLQGRMDWNGWTEAEVSREDDRRIRVQIPGVEDAEAAIESIGKTAQLFFTNSSGEVLLTGDMVADAHKEVGATSNNGVAMPYVALVFTDEGEEKFAQATKDYLGQPIHIVMDDEIISSPVVQNVISDGAATITGHFTGEEAEELASLIRAGSLPFNLTVMQMNHVDATLGADALESGIIAGAIGLALVLLFMTLFYKVLGFAASWALIIYMALELIALSAFNVTLTLPGVAGIIVSMGMAVDANVVIFERIKEELIVGKTLRVALKNGFSKALPAIVDGNVTTLIAGAILFLMGSGAIKGFATTLIIGILLSMFTALIVTRIIVNNLMKAGIYNPKNYGFKK